MELNRIFELYGYNCWADQQALAAAGKLDSGEFLRPMGNSFSSVRDTLAHILSGEWIWLERWQGRYPTELLNPADFPTVHSLFGFPCRDRSQGQFPIEELCRRLITPHPALPQQKVVDLVR